jgi:hypothetical protein
MRWLGGAQPVRCVVPPPCKPHMRQRESRPQGFERRCIQFAAIFI